MRFAPEILKRLGEELVPHPDLGIIELVRNAYDADAERCMVELRKINEAGGSIIVHDVGDGMGPDEIHDGFLLLGRSSKIDSGETPRGRRKVGEKGLGRLSALRLGRRVDVRTRPASEPGVEYQLKINWDDFESVVAVEDIELEIKQATSREAAGTTIEISDIRSPLAQTDVERLARSLVMLTGPFPDVSTNFVAELRSPEFTQIERIVGGGYFDQCEYILTARLDASGEVTASLCDRNGTVLQSGTTDDIMPRSPDRRGSQSWQFMAPPTVELKLWMFNLNKVSFDAGGNRVKGLRNQVSGWLKEVGGFHIYHRGLRVQPYGDPGYDWLEMNALRTSNPELRPATTTSVGRIILEDGENPLTPKTDRSGFVEDLSFRELREFARAVLEWAAYVRLDWRVERNQEARQKTKARIKETQAAVDKAMALVPKNTRPLVQKAVEEERFAFNERLRIIEEDLLLYRTLSTVGTTTAVFAHETLRPVDTIEQMIGSVRRRARRELGERYDQILSRPIDLIERAAGSLRTFAELPLKLLKNRKRRPSVVDINSVIRDLVSMFAPYLEDAHVNVDFELSPEPGCVHSTVASVEAIAANIVANAVAVFSIPLSGGARKTGPDDPNHGAIPASAPGLARRMLIRTTLTPSHVQLSFLDNGPGIRGLSATEVWLPGRSTREGGTGLGLTIVRDIVADLRGRTWAVEQGELGGAEFHISIPRATSTA